MVVAATGFFDGVHRGHRQVLSELCNIARREGKRSAVITFWPHPRNVLQQQAYDLRLLNSPDEKEDLIKKIGVDEVITVPFTKEFSTLTTQAFLKDYLKEKYDVSTLVIGYDHRLGNDTSQSQQKMIEAAGFLGIRVARVEEFLMDGSIISSTKIRKLLSDGNVLEANKFLGYRYGLKGAVVSGNKIGRTMGFPTANMRLYNPLKAVPGNGVYVVLAEVIGKTYVGICNIGTRPTVGTNNEQTIETYILDFDEDIYGLDLKIEFVQKIRDEEKFPSLEALKAQMERDKQFAADMFAGIPVDKLR